MRNPVLSLVTDLPGAVAGLLWPETCAACGTNAPARADLCADCAQALLDLVTLGYCPRCGATLGPGLRAGEEGCFDCPAVVPRFDRLIRVGPHTHPLRGAIHALKYRRLHSPDHLAGLLADAVRAGRDGAGADVVLPVPMHWMRRLARGRNHSALLAAGLAERLGLPRGDELVRVRNTPPQVHLPASRRAENVRGAFAVKHAAGLAGAHVLLVDDVLTTGATANEAARTLLDAGAARVTAAVLAKAESPRAYSHALRG